MPEVPVGARLLAFAHKWEQITQDPWVLQIVKEGYVIPFDHKPPLSHVPMALASGHPAIPEAIQVLLEKRAVERVLDTSSPGFYSRLFLVPKKNGSFRPVIDLSRLNQFLDNPSFKMETPAFIKASIRPSHWGVSLDLSDAYFHVPIHPRCRKYLRFSHNGQVFQFRALPFGLATAPRVFTKLMAAVGAFLRLQGTVLLQYFDDWLLHQIDPQRLRLDLEAAWSRIQSLGLLLNPEKSELIPSQDFVFVGMNFLTLLDKVRVPLQRSQSLVEHVVEFSTLPHAPAREFLSLIGSLSAAADLVHLGRLHLRPIQMYLASRWSQSAGNLWDLVPIDSQLRFHLQWWTNMERLKEGVRLSPQVAGLQLITDASQVGWGAHLEPLGLMTSGCWSQQESLLHINNLEMRAAFLAVQHFQDSLRSQCVLISSDNTTVVTYIKKQGGTHSQSLYQETSRLFHLCDTLRVTLQAKHIPGRLNALADGLSRARQLLPSEWSLHQEVANLIFEELGRPMFDLFATRLNHRLPLYVSPVLDPAAWAIDALTLDWTRMVAYAFPPFNLIPQVLGKISISRHCRVLLVAPWWPQRSWFNDLLDLLIGLPRALPARSDLLSQRGTLHTNPVMFHLHVWPLSSDPSERDAFLRELPLSSQHLDDSLQMSSTMLSGEFSQIGVHQGRLIRSTPLRGD